MIDKFEITDNMTADDVWEVISDILDSVALTDTTINKYVYHTVRDYVTNHYGD